MSEELKVTLKIYETRYEELHKFIVELSKLNNIKMNSVMSNDSKFSDEFDKMFELILDDASKVKSECRRLHKLVYPEKYDEFEE